MCHKLDSMPSVNPELAPIQKISENPKENDIAAKVVSVVKERLSHSDSEIVSPRVTEARVFKKEPCTIVSFLKKPLHCASQKILPINTKDYYVAEIAKIEPLSLRNQLSDLHALLLMKDSNDTKTTQKIMDFALGVAQSDQKSYFKRKMLGILIYFSDFDTHFLNSLLISRPDASIKIMAQFNERLNQIKKKLEEKKASHEKTSIQDPERAYHTLLPIELAKILITETGVVNIGIINALRHKFCTTHVNPYQTNTSFVLKAILVCPMLQETIRSFSVPIHNRSSTDLIRISLGYPSSVLLTPNDAKKAALAALFSHMRQGPANSCFASFLAIGMLSTCLNQCLKDFKNVLHKGYLIRKVHGKSIQFPFILKTSTESAVKLVKMDRNGRLLSSKQESYIWEAPGIQAACRAIGIIKVKAQLLKSIADLFEGHADSDFVEISIPKFIRQIILSKNQKIDSHVYNKALLAFESQMHNPLLRIWENVIAGMAEAELGGVVKSSLLKSVVAPLKKYFEENKIQADYFLEEFATQIGETAKYQYDPDIKTNQVARDGRSNRGAFILHNAYGTKNATQWHKVDTPVRFINYIYSMICRLCQQVLADKPDLAEQICNFVQTQEFLKLCLENYDVSNSLNTDLLNEMNKLQHTPWIDKTGNNSKEVLRVYFDLIQDLEAKELKPVNALELLKSLIKLTRKLPAEFKKSLAENYNKHTPVLLNSIHAFSLMLGHPSFQKLWQKSPSEIDEWIERRLIAPGKAIADSILSEGGRQKIVLMAAANVIQQGDLRLFKEKLKSIPMDISIANFRKQLLSIIRELVSEGLPSINTIKEGLDSAIYKYVLTDEQRTVLQKAAIHFADTNWGESIHDIHFCFIVNPGTGQLELWEGLENGQDLYPLHQSEWLQKQQWELFPIFWNKNLCTPIKV